MIPVGDVLREGGLAALRLSHRVLVQLGAADPVRPGAQSTAMVRPEGPAESHLVGLGQLTYGLDAGRPKALERLRADAGEQRGRLLADGSEPVVVVEREKAVRLVEIRGDLRHQLVGRQPDRADQVRGLANAALDLLGARLGDGGAREVDVGSSMPTTSTSSENSRSVSITFTEPRL